MALNRTRQCADNEHMAFWPRFLALFGLGGSSPTRAASAPTLDEPAGDWNSTDSSAPEGAHSGSEAADPEADLTYVPGTVRRQDLAIAESSRQRQALDQVPSALPKERGIAHFDREEALTVILEGPEEEILWRIARRIESRRLDLPTLPSTSMAVIDLANNPTVEFRELVSQISTDPVLSSELLRTANSVLYVGEEPVDTLHAAVVRIGLRALRSMIFSVSMRGTILRSGVLSEYAEDVWRQSHSVAMTARSIAPLIGVDPEKAFLLGLLQDIGKIALLAMLSKEVKNPRDCTPALVGHVFQVYHQEAGAAMARKWKLPAEFISVAGCHHDWAENTEYERSAALANLAHHLDLALSLSDEKLWAAAINLPALAFLAPQEDLRQRVLMHAQATHPSSVQLAQTVSADSSPAPR